MKYLLLICEDGPIDPAAPELTTMREDAEAWVSEMDGKGIRLMGNRVRKAADATSVRVRSGDTLVVDGPYAETKDQMAGFDVIECDDLDQAIEVAAKHPMSKLGVVEIRPFWTEADGD